MFSKRQAFFGAVVVAVLACFLTGAGIFYLIGNITGDTVATLKMFRAMLLIKNNYVESVPPEKVIAGAIDGMARSVGDPYTSYLQGGVYESLRSGTEGYFDGIGIVLGRKDGELIVISPIENTPGEKAGLKKGDKILKIDGESTAEMTIDVAASKIKGKRGTSVNLEVRKATDGSITTLSIERSAIKYRTVASENLGDSMGYVRVSFFSETTFADLKNELAKLDEAGVKGIILDLRHNPGGLLDSAVDIGQFFVPEGPIVSVVNRNGDKKVFSSHNTNLKYKLVILTDGGSASASEILAGAVKDTGAGKIVGEKTVGKGSVQAVFDFNDKSALKVTYATYYSPNGNNINGVGITPDIEVKNTQMRDDQFEKAKQVLKDLLAE